MAGRSRMGSPSSSTMPIVPAVPSPPRRSSPASTRSPTHSGSTIGFGTDFVPFRPYASGRQVRRVSRVGDSVIAAHRSRWDPPRKGLASAAGRAAAEPGLGHGGGIEQPVHLGRVHPALERQLADGAAALERLLGELRGRRRSRSPGASAVASISPCSTSCGPRAVAVSPSMQRSLKLRGRGAEQRRSTRASRRRSPAASR